MNFDYLVQDEQETIDQYFSHDKNKFKDPIEISIKITIERTRYNSVINRRKTPLPELIKNLFKPAK